MKLLNIFILMFQSFLFINILNSSANHYFLLIPMFGIYFALGGIYKSKKEDIK